MRLVLIAVAAMGVLVAGQAEARPDTRTMQCKSIQPFVKAQGSVVMTTGEYTFARFVADSRFCDTWEVARPRYVPSKDKKRCPVYGVCEDRAFDFSLDLFD